MHIYTVICPFVAVVLMVGDGNRGPQHANMGTVHQVDEVRSLAVQVNHGRVDRLPVNVLLIGKKGQKR